MKILRFLVVLVAGSMAFFAIADAGSALADARSVPTVAADSDGGAGLPASSAAGPAVVFQDEEQNETEPEDDEDDKKDEPLPLEPTRTLTFSSSAGTWLSLDVSPDGGTILFEYLGDLYTVPSSGGAATRLTEGMAFDSQPRYSPEGDEVLFVSDRSGGENLWILDLTKPAPEDDEADDERLRQLTKGNNNGYVSPEWLPDGDYVVASKSDGLFGARKLWMWHVDGGSGIQLIKEPENLHTIGAAPTPGGRYIYFGQRTGVWQYNAIFPQYQVGVYDRETGQRYTRTYRFGSAVRPTISPDGQWMVYGTRHEAQTGLRARNLDTGDEHWLAYPVQRDDQESVASRDVLPGMSFTPDSEELVVSYGGRIWRLPIAGGTATEVPFTVDVEVPIGAKLDFDYPIEDTPEFVVRQIRDAVPSPDSSKLAFTALDRLYVMDWPGGQPARLGDLDNVQAQPAWSPDGEWVAFVTWSEQQGGHVHKARASGGDVERLTTTPGIYQQPAWSPTGDRIVVIRGPARVYREASGPFAPGATDDLVWIPADGGEARLIAPTEGRTAPHFVESRPDRIYLYHGGGFFGGGEAKGLVSIRFDGTDEKAHVKVTGATLPGASRPMTAGLVMMAPEGDRALAVVNNDIYVVTVPLVGGETPTISVANPDSAAFPVRKLTEIGGQFPAWGSTGSVVHWSIGNAHFVYDLDAAKAAEAKARDEKEREEQEGGEGDGAGQEGEGQEKPEDEEDADEDEEPAYQPQEARIEITATRDIPDGLVVLRGARVITMVGDEVIEDADVVVRDNRIRAVGPRGTLEIPGDPEVIDVSGKTIVPGYVDTHAHMWPSWGIHKSQVWMYLTNLAYGVTTTRDPQTATTDVLTYADRVRTGEMLGPRVYSTGPGIFRSEQWKSLEHTRKVLKRYSEYYDTKTLKMYMAGNRQQRQWILMAAREQELMPTTEGGLDFKLNLTMLIDGYSGQEHSFPIFPVYEDFVKLVAFTGMTYTPTLLVAYGGPWAENWFYTRENPHDDAKLRRFVPHDEIDRRTRRRGAGAGPGPGGWFMEEEHVFPELAEVAKDIVEAGGRVGVGSHGQLDGLGYHWELWAIQSGGMGEHDALRVATLFGAEAIGLDQDLGSIEVGKLADLVVLDGDPLDDIRNTAEIAYVMKNGRLYDGDTLDEVYPRQRTLEIEWLQDDPDVEAGIGQE